MDWYQEAKARADQLESDPANEKHQADVLVPHFARAYSPVLRNCLSTIKNPDTSTLNIVVLIEKSGVVKKVYSAEDTNTGRCLLKELEQGTFPEPLVSPYYLHLEVVLK